MTGDTDSTDVLLTDEDMADAMTANLVLTRAAAACCLLIIAKLARRGVDRRIGQTSISNSQLIQNYRLLRMELLQDGGDAAPSGSAPPLAPIAGGISVAENQRIEGDQDFIRSPLGHHQDDFHGNALDSRLTEDAEDGWRW